MTSANDGFVATHTVPAWGADLWSLPDPGPDAEQQPVAELPGGTEVQVVERRPDGWVRLTARGGPQGWTDGRHLEATPPDESVDADAMELIAQLQGALSACSRLLEDVKDGRIDAESFHAQAFRAGLVLRDGEAWMWDFAHGWHRYDGVTLRHVTFEERS
ncbi:SH3 domain-containing protein [Streptomyces sp. VNUA116]|uniref:SH3 domain-containing protein n=1 Tax=Streptomyces sp. VNUA116 TaxID=3062449 RepID=UPI0026753360|nr:SH3 domain-containing protein [Streptomyces sp. VNUA116]WKU47564.1 SH3 domain-containing protein [Streptomyces sp. VNUA116]